MPAAPRALRVRAALLAAWLAALPLGCGGAWAQTRPTVLALEEMPVSLVYADDSFFAESFRAVDGLGTQVASLLRGAGSVQSFVTTPVVISGPRLDWYDVMTFMRPRSVAPADLEAHPARHRLFDIAVMADCGRCSLRGPALGDYIARTQRDAETVRRHGGQPVFFMAWAGPGRADATARLAEAYTRAGNATAALVIPAGLAFARAAAERPDLPLFDEREAPDQAGTYLAASITYAALFGISPVGNRYLGGLEPETAAFLQRVAWETAWLYYAGTAPRD
jgi:hypothetical protein